MPISWTDGRLSFKSPLRVVAGVLWRSRERKTQKCRRLKQQIEEAQRKSARQEAEIRRLKKEVQALKQQAQRQNPSWQQAPRGCCLPADSPLKGHKYGRRLIRLAVNLARIVGLRASERVLKMIWEWLGVKEPLPDWTTIRMWLLRVGVATLREPVERANDWVWMADHSNQIGPEKALVVLGVRA